MVVSLGQLSVSKLFDLTALYKDIKNLIKILAVAILAIVSYTYLFKFYEKREIKEFSKIRLLKHLTIGIDLGALLQSLTIFVIYLKGGYLIVSINPIIFSVLPLIMAFTSAIFEEILIREIIFRITEEKLGSYFPLLISGFLFGAMHLGNPNSSLTAAITLAIQAGLLLASAFIY